MILKIEEYHDEIVEFIFNPDEHGEDVCELAKQF
jgi:hypothetical protein